MQDVYNIGGDFVNSGDVSIWDASSVCFNANYRQDSTGTLSLKVWGLNDFNKMEITGEAALGGILEIDFINDYVPLPGETFEIMTCGSRTGTFSSIVSNMPEITFEPTYTDNSLTLTVAVANGNVCKIGAAEYPTLDDALAAFQNGETIELLKDIDYTNDSSNPAILTDGKNITFDLSGYTLNINNPTGEGVNLLNQAEMLFTGGGELIINSKFSGLHADNSEFISDVTVDVDINSSHGCAVDVNLSTVQILKGSASGYAEGIYAYSNSTITVNGPVTAACSYAVWLDGIGSTVNVGSAVVTGGTGAGVYVRAGGSVTVGSTASPGTVSDKGAGVLTGKSINHRAHVTVYGDVEGINGIFVYGGSSNIKVFGNITATPTKPAYNADVKAGSGTETTLPVTVDKDAGIASIDTGSHCPLTASGPTGAIPTRV